MSIFYYTYAIIYPLKFYIILEKMYCLLRYHADAFKTCYFNPNLLLLLAINGIRSKQIAGYVEPKGKGMHILIPKVKNHNAHTQK